MDGSEEYSNLTTTSFNIQGHLFDKDTDAVISTFPVLKRINPINNNKLFTIGASILSLVLHSNSASGYLGLSRLAWPVVPPMVRGAYSHNLPDFVVISSNKVWSLGPGAVQMAGYWDSEWKVDESQLYLRKD